MAHILFIRLRTSNRLDIFANIGTHATKPMKEVFSHMDSTRVAMIDDVIKSEGILTMIKNWTGSNITKCLSPRYTPRFSSSTMPEPTRPSR